MGIYRDVVRCSSGCCFSSHANIPKDFSPAVHFISRKKIYNFFSSSLSHFLNKPAHCGEIKKSIWRSNQMNSSMQKTSGEEIRNDVMQRVDKHCEKHSSGSETQENVNLKREAGWPSRRRRQFLCRFNREMINSRVFTTGVVAIERISQCKTEIID